jgi:hypothetical protein
MPVELIEWAKIARVPRSGPHKIRMHQLRGQPVFLARLEMAKDEEEMAVVVVVVVMEEVVVWKKACLIFWVLCRVVF